MAVDRRTDEHRQVFRYGSSRTNPDVRVLVLGVQLPAGQGTVGIRCVFWWKRGSGPTHQPPGKRLMPLSSGQLRTKNQQTLPLGICPGRAIPKSLRCSSCFWEFVKNIVGESSVKGLTGSRKRDIVNKTNKVVTYLGIINKHFWSEFVNKDYHFKFSSRWVFQKARTKNWITVIRQQKQKSNMWKRYYSCFL